MCAHPALCRIKTSKEVVDLALSGLDECTRDRGNLHSEMAEVTSNRSNCWPAKTGYPGSVADAQMDGMMLLAQSGH